MDEDERDHRGAAPFPDRVVLRPVAVIHSPYAQRHGTPRQPGHAGPKEDPRGEGLVALLPGGPAALLQDLGGFSHVWLLSCFHLNGPRKAPLVRPPRGGPKRGVFATRAPHRPNPLGLSAVRLLAVEGRALRVADLDLIDGTPILDIKPYIPDFDAIPGASRGWLDG